MEIKLHEVRYIGRCKERQGGSYTAYGWCNKSWSVAITKNALYQWFGMSSRPNEEKTFYNVLGIAQTATDQDVKTAYKRMAKQWHPDVCREPDARKQFDAIKHAYDILSSKRARYDAGLALQESLTQIHPQKKNEFDLAAVDEFGYRSPLRCGWILAEGEYGQRMKYSNDRKFTIERILGWEDIVRADGKVLVSSWIYGEDAPREEWS